MNFNTTEVVDSILFYLNRDDIDTTIEDEKLIHQDLLVHFENCLAERTAHTAINNIYRFFSYYLYRNALEIKQIFPTLNAQLRKLNLIPIDRKFTKIEFQKEYKEIDYENLDKKIQLINLIINMFKFENYVIDNKFIEQLSYNSENKNLIFQNFSQKNTDDYIICLLDKLYNLLILNKDSEFYHYVKTFLTTVNFMLGTSVVSAHAMFLFFDLLINFANKKNFDQLIIQQILTIKKLYIDIFFKIKDLIPFSQELIDLEKDVSLQNNAILNVSLLKIDKGLIDSLNKTFKVEKNLWYSPIIEKPEETFDESLIKQIDNFILNNDNTLLENKMLESHQLKLMLIIKLLYSISRQGHPNKRGVEIIKTIENFIDSFIEHNGPSLLEKRFLSLISVKNSLKMLFNEYFNEWTPESIINKTIKELDYINSRKYIINPATIGKLTQEFAKLQDYMNMKNIYMSLETNFQKNIRTMTILDSIRTLLFLGDDRMDYDILDNYDMLMGNSIREYDYNFFRHQESKWHYMRELGNNFLSGVKFVGPAFAITKNDIYSYKTSIDEVNNYWNFYKHNRGDLIFGGKNKVELVVYKNSNYLKYI